MGPAARTGVGLLSTGRTNFSKAGTTLLQILHTFLHRIVAPPPIRCPRSQPPLRTTPTASSAPPSLDCAHPAWSEDEEGSLTTSIAEPRPHRPVLRRLADFLPPPMPSTPQAAPTTAQPAPAANPAASVLAERVLRAAVEILGGRRSLRQLSPVLSPDLLAYLATLQAVAGHLQPRVHKVFAQQQAAGVVEAVALMTLSTGVRALAARFEEHVDERGRRWRCTALQLRLTSGDVAIRRDPRIRRP